MYNKYSTYIVYDYKLVTIAVDTSLDLFKKYIFI